MKKFLAVNFGCRVNSAETNQYSQTLVDQGYTPDPKNPDLIFINTCAVTKKGEYESISTIRKLTKDYPTAEIIVTGCANLDKIKDLKNVTVFDNSQKESFLSDLHCEYTHKIDDKFSHTHRYLLKIQSGCSQFCSYCAVPLKRNYLWSLPVDTAINTVNKAIRDGYREIIITGVNIDQYQYGLSNLVSSLLKYTIIPLISFGSIPINSINDRFIKLYQQYPDRLSHFLHLPIQSGSDKILKLMHRSYNVKKIKETFTSLRAPAWQSFSFGTDIIIGFPGEIETDFQKTIGICHKIGFSKIHTFRFSPRPGTLGLKLFKDSPKISNFSKKSRSQKLRSLVVK